MTLVITGSLHLRIGMMHWQRLTWEEDKGVYIYGSGVTAEIGEEENAEG